MSEYIKRMHYYDGLFLGSEDFVTEQNYNLRMRRLHNRHLHSAGIVHGLEVIAEDSNYKTIIIKPGMALDRVYDETHSESISREILITENTFVNLDAANYAPGSSVFIWIQYSEKKADENLDVSGSQPVHWQEEGRPGHSTTRPLDENSHILLARVVLDGGGKVYPDGILTTDENGKEIRLFSGFTGNRVQANMFTFLDPDISESHATAEGKLFVGGQRGIDISSQRTHFSGDVALDGRLQVSGDIIHAGENLRTQLNRKRHYHGSADVTSDAPHSIDLFMEDSQHTPRRVLLALRGDRFPRSYYTEMGYHKHKFATDTFPHHDHRFTADGDHKHTVTNDRHNHTLHMGYADLLHAGGGKKNNNHGVNRLIVSVDMLDEDPWLPKNGTSYNGHTTINDAPVYSNVSIEPTHFHNFLSDGGHNHNGITELSGTSNSLVRSTSIRNGPEYNYLNELRIQVDGNDITDSFINRMNHGWTKLGNADSGEFNGTSTGLIDITDLLGTLPPPSGVLQLNFVPTDGGGKLHYDVICE